MAVCIERIDLHVCYIGRARGINRKKRLRLQEIGPAADWALTCSAHKTTDIKRSTSVAGTSMHSTQSEEIHQGVDSQQWSVCLAGTHTTSLEEFGS